MLVVVDRAIDTQLSLEISFCLVELSERYRRSPELVERGCDARVHGAIDVLLNDERLFQHPGRIGVSLLGHERAAEYRHRRCRFLMARPIPPGGDVQRLAVVPLGLCKVSELELNGSEVYQIIGDVRVTLAVEAPIHGQHAPVE